MKSILKPFETMYSHRRMLVSTTISEIKKKYAGSALGLMWVVLYPFLFLAVYAAVYGFILKVGTEQYSTIEYIIFIFSGLIPFLGFSEAINTGVMSVSANAGLIKNTLFPVELIPVRTVFCAQTTQLSGTIILLIGLLIMLDFSLYVPLIFFIWVLQIMMEIGITWFLSSINVVIRDLQNLVSVIMLLLMMASPIAYDISFIPEFLRPLMSLNPVYCFIIAYKDVLFYRQMPAFSTWAGMLFWGCLVFVLGYIFFMKMKRVFVDNV